MSKLILLLSFILLFQQGNIAEGVMKESFVSKELETSNFKEVVVKKENGNYIITGKAKVKKGVFYFNVEDGHRILFPETKVRVHNLYWTSFKLSFSIPKNVISDNGVLILNLYEKNKSKETDHFPVFLESN